MSNPFEYRTARIFWNKKDPTMLGIDASERLTPDEFSIENAFFSAYRAFGLPRNRVTVVTLDLKKQKHREILERALTLCTGGRDYCGRVELDEKGRFLDVFVSEPRPDAVSEFDWNAKAWVSPDNAEALRNDLEIEDTLRTEKAILANLMVPALALLRAMLDGTEPDENTARTFRVNHDALLECRQKFLTAITASEE